MTKKLMFDTLSYSKKLENGGVSHPDVFAEALSDALIQNINTKEEVEKMLADAMKHFENAIRESNDAIKQSNDAIKQSNERFEHAIKESNQKSEKRFEQLTHEMEKKIIESNNSIKETNLKIEKNMAQDREAHAKEMYEIGNRAIVRLGAAIGIPVAVLTIFVLLNTLGIHFNSLEIPGVV